MLVSAFTKPQPAHQTSNPYLWGTGLTVAGVLLVFMARRWRNLVRTNPRYARIAGVMDVMNMFR